MKQTIILRALAFALVFLSAVYAQLPPNLDCKCVATGGDEYLCKCTVVKSAESGSAGTVLPTAAPAPPKSALVPVPTGTATKGSETPTGTTTAKGQEIYTGPRGGQYHYSSSGKKVYTRKK